MLTYVAGDVIYRVFRHYLDTTGLADGDFTKVLCRNGISNGTSFTITEIGSGYYKIALSLSQSGQWFLDVYETADPLARYTTEFVVGKASANAVTNETLSESISASEVKIRGDIDRQAIDEIKRLVQGLYDRIARVMT